MDKVLKIEASQNGEALPIEIQYNRMIWSGLSWAAGEIPEGKFDPNQPVTVRCSSSEKDPMRLKPSIFLVAY
jgi:hypothetical protein